VNRLRLNHLTFVGANVEPASVEFGPGTTVVRGPSDSGKSFMVDAIDYLLGATTLKEIPQREGYTMALLGLTLPSGEQVTLSRSVTGGAVGRYTGDLRSAPRAAPPVSLASKHNTKSRGNLSRYLLSQIELDEKRIRKNVTNETDSLSFRNVALLCVVDETAMQAETPPALTGSPTTKTKEISTLKLLLQNEDDSHLTAVPSKKERKRLANAKAEVLDRLLADLENQIRDAGDLAELQRRIERLNTHVERHTDSIAGIAAERSRQIRELAKAERLATAARRSLTEAETLDSRFRLLHEQYTSDLRRLEMVAEAGTLLGYFNPGQCVFCGADPAHQHFNEGCADDTTAFGESVLAEQHKTTALRNDLVDALTNLDVQRGELAQRLTTFIDQANDARAQLQRLENDLSPQQETLSELLTSRTELEKLLDAHAQIAKFNALKAELASEAPEGAVAAIAGLHTGALTDLSNGIATRLRAWGVPDANRVRYDRSAQDLIAGDQLRSAHGKGVRAILHAAFTIALAQYCFDRNLPHPGFVVLDSPLVTYRPPEHGEAIDTDDVLDPGVAAKFYADVQQNFDGQIIIMENMDPPNGLDEESVDVPFTKNLTRGRYGFFPHVENPRSPDILDE
jgi:hypothetical protein